MIIDESLLSRLPRTVTTERESNLSTYTTFKLGGPCPAVISCPSADSLIECAKTLSDQQLPFIVIGQGSNLLVSDDGLDCIVLRYCAESAPQVMQDGCRIHVAGNTLLDDLASNAIDAGLGDISFCSGIPGTVGGAIAGNAGAFGQQIGDVVESVRLMNSRGSIQEVDASYLEFEYRSSALKKTNDIILDAVLKLKPCNVQTMENERNRIMDLRKEKHPDWKINPCAGSVFRNVEPTSAADRRQAAGWFLEQAGAKDFQVGGACIYEKHANIIIAEPNASAADVYELTEMMIDAVEKKFSFKLQREIKTLGDFQ